MSIARATDVSDAIARFAQDHPRRNGRGITASGNEVRIPVDDRIMQSEQMQDDIAGVLARIMSVAWNDAEKKESGYRYVLSENNDWWATFDREDQTLVIAHRYGNTAVLGSLAILICHRCGLGNKE